MSWAEESQTLALQKHWHHARITLGEAGVARSPERHFTVRVMMEQ